MKKSNHYDIARTISERIASRTKQDRAYTVQLQREADRLTQAIQALGKIAESRSPLDTEAGHFKKVSTHAKRLKSEAEKAQERIQTLQYNALGDIENRMNDRLGMKEGPHGAELRAALRSMDEGERHRTIQQLIKEGDGQSLAAVTNAPALLSGIDQEFQSRYASDFQAMHAPEINAEQESLMETVSDMAAITSAAKHASDTFNDPETLQRIEEGEAQASEAEIGFSAALQ